MFRIKFKPQNGAEVYLDAQQYGFHSRETADRAARDLRTTNNPAWKGEFIVVPPPDLDQPT